MFQVTHSPFMQALGYAIINSLWQFALLWLIYVLINTLLKLSSHQKYTAGLLLQVSGFIWFIVTFIFYFHHYSQLAEIFFPLQKVYSFYIAESDIVSGRDNFFAWIIQIERCLPYLSVAYLVLLVFISFKWIKAYNFTQSIRTKGLHTIQAEWRLFVAQLSAQLGIKREVKIYLSEMIKTPLTIGFFKPLILIPLASLNHLSADQMEAVILHELAHIKRFDYLFNLFLAVIETALFFNPFMALISRHIKRERENCCDDRVLQYNYNATSYAVALLQLATFQSSSYLLALQAADNKQALLNRIKRMIEKKEISFFNYRYQLIALFVIITVLSSLALLSSRLPIKNVVALSVPAEVIAKQMTSALSDSSLNFGSNKNTDEKRALNKELKPGRISKEIVSFDTPTTKPVINNTASLSPDEMNTETMPAEEEEVLLANNYKASAEDLKKEIDISNMRLDEVTASLTHTKDDEIALAEKGLQKIAVNLFNEKQALFNQEQVNQQMKAVAEQLHAVKIQSALIEYEKALCHLKEIKMQNMPQLTPAAIAQLRLVTKKIQQAMEQAQKRNAVLFKAAFNFTNNDLILQPKEFSIPSERREYSFSFELPQKLKANVVIINSSTSHKKTKKINKVFIEENNDNIIPEKTRNKSFSIIKI